MLIINAEKESDVKIHALLRKNYNGIFLSDVIFTIGSFILSSMFFSLEKSLLICFVIGAISVVINMKWNLRWEPWFWATLFIFFSSHMVLIFSIPMPQEFKMAAAFAPIVIAEGLVLLGIIGFIEKRTN